MQCRVCGATLPQGASNCPTCGARVPSYGGAGSPGQYDPTKMASPPGSAPPPGPSYGGAGSPGQYDPTVMASPPGSVPPPGPSYGGPGNPGQYDPTVMAFPPGSAPPPGPFTSYAPPASPYAPPPASPYGAPGPQYSPPGYLPQQPPPYPPMPGQPFPGQQPRRSRTGLIIGIVAGAFLLSCIGCSMISSLLAHTGNNNGKTSPTTTQVPAATSTLSDVATVASTTQANGSNPSLVPTAVATVAPTTSASGPNQSIVPAAAAIITSVTTARSVNTVTAQPVNPATTFQTNATVYVAFTLTSQHDFTASPGYVQVKFYAGTSLIGSTSLPVAKAAPGGYFSDTYDVPTAGSAALYWCTQANCSDAQLAQVATFTITT